MTIEADTSDRLLTEIERQEKYLAKLPENFTFPLFNAAQALESQRRSGYRNTAAAAREIVDNAIEAQATRIDICFERPKQLKAYQRAESISAIAFIDNGSGMLPKMAQYALSWGSGTHFDDPAFIGKFGFGLPNASINQTRFVEVYTKTAGAERVTKAWLDARAVKNHGLQSIPEPGIARSSRPPSSIRTCSSGPTFSNRTTAAVGPWSRSRTPRVSNPISYMTWRLRRGPLWGRGFAYRHSSSGMSAARCSKKPTSAGARSWTRT